MAAEIAGVLDREEVADADGAVPTPRLRRTLTVGETWGFGFTGLLLWLFVAEGPTVDLGIGDGQCLQRGPGAGPGRGDGRLLVQAGAPRRAAGGAGSLAGGRHLPAGGARHRRSRCPARRLGPRPVGRAPPARRRGRVVTAGGALRGLPGRCRYPAPGVGPRARSSGWPPVVEAAHRLKGQAASLGATAAAQLLGQLEAIGRAGQLDAGRDLLTSVKSQLQRVREELAAVATKG